MSFKHLLSFALVSAVAVAAAPGPQGSSHRIGIRIFEIPPHQSVTSAGPSDNGSIVGTTVGGYVTRKFPGQPVIVPTALAPDAREEDLKYVLYDRGYLDRSCLPTGVYWANSGTYSISLPERDLGMESGRKEYHEPGVAPSWDNRYVSRSGYWLTMIPIAASENEMLLEIVFANAARTVLFNRQVSVPLGRTTLIGFRALASSGSVFVIAVSVEGGSMRRSLGEPGPKTGTWRPGE